MEFKLGMTVNMHGIPTPLLDLDLDFEKHLNASFLLFKKKKMCGVLLDGLCVCCVISTCMFVQRLLSKYFSA